MLLCTLFSYCIVGKISRLWHFSGLSANTQTFVPKLELATCILTAGFLPVQVLLPPKEHLAIDHHQLIVKAEQLLTIHEQVIYYTQLLIPMLHDRGLSLECFFHKHMLHPCHTNVATWTMYCQAVANHFLFNVSKCKSMVITRKWNSRRSTMTLNDTPLEMVYQYKYCPQISAGQHNLMKYLLKQGNF